MDDLTGMLKAELLCHGADLVGVGDLNAFPPEQRYGMPYGVAIAVKYPKEVIHGITDMPTRAYYDQYNAINERLAGLAALGVDMLCAFGYQAATRHPTDETAEAVMPHKTVATRAGLGWIGKCALLVTKEYGSAVRLVPVFTDAELRPARPVNRSKCGDCTACAAACPGKAVLGKNWVAGMPREEIYDAALCRATARVRALIAFGIEQTICGRCIAACPHTLKYINS